MLITTKAIHTNYAGTAVADDTAKAVTTTTTTVKKTTEASTGNTFSTKQMVLAVVGTALAAGAGSVYVANKNFSDSSSIDRTIYSDDFNNKITVVINDDNKLNTDNKKETENIKGKIVIEISDKVPIENDSNFNKFLDYINYEMHNKINEIQDHIKNNKKAQ